MSRADTEAAVGTSLEKDGSGVTVENGMQRSAAPAAAESCELCARKSHHYPHECTFRCPSNEEGGHIFVGHYANYGYWWGRCSECGHKLEVDSSG